MLVWIAYAEVSSIDVTKNGSNEGHACSNRDVFCHLVVRGWIAGSDNGELVSRLNSGGMIT